MAQKNVAETIQCSNITTGEVKAVIDRAANRIAFLMTLLREYSEKPSSLRTVMGDRKHFMDGSSSLLSAVCYDLNILYKRLYPETKKYWGGPDLSCELTIPIAKLNLALDNVFFRLDFTEKADDMALCGCVEFVQDILDDLIEMSGHLEVHHVA